MNWRKAGVDARMRGRIELALLGLASLSLIVPAGRAAETMPAPAPPPAAKQIALSFDDVPRGPGAFLTPQARAGRLLSALQDAQVPQVAFFVNPRRIGPGNGAVPMIDAYVAAGHVIGNHTFGHLQLNRTSAPAYLADIDRAERWLAGRPGYRPWFRFPYLDEGGRDHAKRDAVRAGLAARGLRDAYVTADGSDWYLDARTAAAKRAGQPIDLTALRDLYVETMVQSADFADRLLQRSVGRSAPQVLLLHETDLAALFVSDLVRALRRDGWEIVSADAAYADPIYRARPDIAFANGTLPEMLAWEQHVGGARWYARNDTRIADRLFRERVLHQPLARTDMGIALARR